MPFSHEIDREHRVVVSRLWGTLTAADLDEHRHAIRSDLAFDPALDLIVDMRGLRELAYPSTKVRDVARRSILHRVRRAIVAATDEQYGVARMYATLAAFEGEEVEVFRTWEPAAAWIGLRGALAEDPGVVAAP